MVAARRTGRAVAVERTGAASGHPRPPRHPGGQVSGLPPMTCAWACGTVCPAGVEHDAVSRLGDSLSHRNAMRLACHLLKEAAASFRDCRKVRVTFFRYNQTCMGACGLISRKEIVRALSRTRLAGMSPSAIPQNRQSATLRLYRLAPEDRGVSRADVRYVRFRTNVMTTNLLPFQSSLRLSYPEMHRYAWLGNPPAILCLGVPRMEGSAT